MKIRKGRTALAGALALGLAACAGPAPKGPNPGDFELRDRAVEPTSQQAAEAAVQRYFEQTLKDPDSARYRFRPYRRGVLDLSGGRAWAGVFMCGAVNARNSYGGYTGHQTFLAYFDPTTADRVLHATVEGSRETSVSAWCSRIY